MERDRIQRDSIAEDGVSRDAPQQLKQASRQAQQEYAKLQKEIKDIRADNEQLEAATAQMQGAYGYRPGTGASSGSGAGKRLQRAREIEQRKDELAGLEGKIKTETAKLENLASKSDDTRKSVMEVRKQMGSVNLTKERSEQIENQIKVLENRLDKALVKFNEALHVNKELREQIDSLRRERGVFDTIYKKLERELQEKKKEMAFIIEVSNIAYEERDNATNELSQLKVYAQKEMQSFEETFKELDELLEEDRKMKEAIKQRMNDRKEKAAETAMKSSMAELEDKPKRKGTPKDGSRDKGPASPSAGNSTEMTQQNYEEVFNTLKQATNMNDINQMVEKFLHSEDDNFSLFKFVNELNNEIEKLEEARNEVKAEMERVKGATGGQNDQGRQQVLKGLEERLNQEEQNSKKYAEMTDSTSKMLENMMACVDRLFAMLDCEETKIVEQQGTAGLSENNLHLYLAAIELKTDEHLMKWRRLNGASDRGPALPFGSTNISIDIPSTGEDYNDAYSDEEERVLTREELLAKTNSKLQKQQNAGGDYRKGAKRGGKKKGY